MIAMIDYGAGNLRSVQKAFEHLGVDCLISRNEEEILNADAVVLPGVGAFADCMDNLVQTGMDRVAVKCIERKMPFLGICLGFQMLFEFSEEHAGGESDIPGLGIFKGKVKRLPFGEGLKIPHMGWNSLQIQKQCPLFDGLPENPYVYFVHSYYVDSSDRTLVSARSAYGMAFDAAISVDNVYAAQFHPEKSGEAGLKMISNFIKVVHAK